MTTLKNTSTYLEILLKNTYDLTLYYHFSEAHPEIVTASRIVFFITKEEGPAVVAILNGWVNWGCWGISKNSEQYLKLVNIINSMH